jgi:Protein of unknown function (DUF2892)
MERQNLGRHEQSVRMVVGSLSPLLGIVLLVPGMASLASGAIGTTLVIAGLYLFVTGSPGYCPIYRRLGWAPWRTEVEEDGSSGDGWRRSEHDGGEPQGRKQRVLMILYCLPLIAMAAWIVLRARGS